MKKKVVLCALLFSSASFFAQDLTSKKGEAILPEAGDWAIQFDAAPFLNYAGNLFSSDTTAPGADFVNSGTIVGKYFKDATTAYRVKLNIGINSFTDKALVPDLVALDNDPGSTATVEDSKKSSSSFIAIGGGMEWRRGKGRLQGFYGGELLFMLSTAKTIYTYGNTYSPAGTPAVSSQVHGVDGTTDAKGSISGSTIGFQLRGFVGCEYFIAPKISIGAEYGWGLGLSSQGAGSSTSQQVSSGGTSMEDVVTETAGSNGFALGADINGGNQLGTASLVATFHF